MSCHFCKNNVALPRSLPANVFGSSTMQDKAGHIKKNRFCDLNSADSGALISVMQRCVFEIPMHERGMAQLTMIG